MVSLFYATEMETARAGEFARTRPLTGLSVAPERR
jgi:hypothetical protein